MYIHYILSSNKCIFVLPICPEVTVHMFTPGKITVIGLLQYHFLTEAHIIPGPSGQYGCFFSRCRRYVINSLGMIARPIWKCPCIYLFIINMRYYFVH